MAKLNVEQYIKELWVAQTLDAAMQTRRMTALVADFSQEVIAQGGDTIHVPLIGTFTPQDAPNDGSLLTPQDTSGEGSIALVINKHKVILVRIAKADWQLALSGLPDKYAIPAGQSLNDAVETELLALSDSAANSVTVSSYNEMFDAVLNARAILDNNNVPETERVIVVHPNAESWLMKVESFVSGDYQEVKPYIQGRFGTLLGMPVYKSPKVKQVVIGANTYHSNLIMHRNFLLYAMGKNGIDFNVDYNIAGVSYDVSWDMLFGVKLGIPTYAVQLLTATT